MNRGGIYPSLVPELLDAVPPSNAEAERAVLGAILLEPRRLAEVSEVVGPEHFHDSRNEAILRHLCRLANENTVLDIVTLRASLKEAGELALAGGAAYIAEVVQSVPAAGHAAHHARLVRQAADKQALRTLGTDLIRLAHATENNGQADLLCEARALLNTVGAGGPGETWRIKYPAMTGPELDAQHYATDFLVEGILPQGHHTILGGPHKSLKTLLASDLAVSLAVGGHFLGYFPVPRAVKVAYMSGECGLPIMQANLRRIARAAGTDLGQLNNLLVTDRLPTFGNATDVAAMGQFIRDNGFKVIFVDPAYLSMPSEDAGNVFAMGTLLRGMAETFVANGATMILLHHTTKVSGLDGEPLELNALSWAGFREFAANWLLVSRREKYEPGSGDHRLWLSVGGREGHGGLWSLDVNEGPYVAGIERLWQVSVSKPDDARAGVQRAKDQTKAKEQTARIDDAKRRIVETMLKYPEGETPRGIRIASGLNPARFDPALAELIREDNIVPCDIQKPNRKTPYEGYKLADEEPL